MNSAYKDAYIEALSVAPKTEQVLDTLELSHPLFPQPYYFVSDRIEFVATLENNQTVTFVPIGMNFTMPKVNSSGVQEMTISFLDVGRQVSSLALSVAVSSEPIRAAYRPYLRNDPGQPQISAPFILFLRDAKITRDSVAAKATFADLLNRPFISKLYTRREFPALA